MYINTNYKTDVQIRYGDLHNMLAWCTKNCIGKWGYSIVDSAGEQPGIYDFKFELEKDYINFLVWKK